LRKVCRSRITYIRYVTELHVCLYACFEGYMLMMLWCMEGLRHIMSDMVYG